jgi:hypothetical protein
MRCDGRVPVSSHGRTYSREPVHFDKITSRIRKLCYGLDARYVDPVEISQRVRAFCCRI